MSHSVSQKLFFEPVKGQAATPRSLEAGQAIIDSADSILLLHHTLGTSRLRAMLRAWGVSVILNAQFDPVRVISYCKICTQYMIWVFREGYPEDEPSFSSVGLVRPPLELLKLAKWFRVWQTSDKLEPWQILRYRQVTMMVINVHRVFMLSSGKLSLSQKRRLKRLASGRSRISYLAIPPKSLASITDPMTTKLAQDYDMIRTLIPAALSKLGITPDSFRSQLKSSMESFRPYVITSAGPNGPAMWSGYKDAYAVMNHTPLASALSSYLEDWGEDPLPFPDGSPVFALLWHLKRAAKKAREMYSSEQLRHFVSGRLHAISELGGKVRIVAILDYWSQMILSPLHDTIAHFLRLIPQDGTFDQSRVSDMVQKWTGDPSYKVFSYDLSAATDRLPRQLQVDILSHLLTPTMATAWADIMSNRPFQTPAHEYMTVTEPDLNYPEKVKYTVGQPMGAKSSFPMLALTHHVIVQVAGMIANVEAEDYVVLGDDNTLAHEDLAHSYHSIMTDVLGMEISSAKSYVHKSGTLSVGEIRKRVYLVGDEISALNPKIVSKLYQNSDLVAEFQNSLVERGAVIADSVLFDLIFSIGGERALHKALDLNSVPKEMSGLLRPVPPTHLAVPSMADRLGISEEQLLEAFSYTSIVQQLKRLDALIRANFSINQVMSRKAGRKDPKWKERFYAHRIKPVDESILVKIPALGDPHPLALAETNEFIRILKLVGDMMYSPASVISRSRRGMLDSVRSSLSTVWLDPSGRKRETPKTRALLDKTIKNVQSIKHCGPSQTLFYETFITSVGYALTVHWRLDSRVHLSPARYSLQKKVLRMLDRMAVSVNMIYLGKSKGWVRSS